MDSQAWTLRLGQESSTQWITDEIVNAAQQLMREVIPGLPSLQDAVAMNFDIQRGTFVQILHTGHGHWNTIAATGEEPAHVQVYDSLYTSLPTSADCSHSGRQRARGNAKLQGCSDAVRELRL